jgi:hypothetical protein
MKIARTLLFLAALAGAASCGNEITAPAAAPAAPSLGACTERTNFMKYEFSLILTELEVTDEDADKLFEAGCDDASILTRDGVTRLQFDRHATNLDEALSSAIHNVERAGLNVARVEIERHEIPQIV